MGKDPDLPDIVHNWTYFLYFADLFLQSNPYDWKHILTEVRLAQRSGPSYPELVPMGGNLFRFIIEDFPGRDDGLIVVVDFEMDSKGHVEPVMGGSNQDLPLS